MGIVNACSMHSFLWMSQKKEIVTKFFYITFSTPNKISYVCPDMQGIDLDVRQGFEVEC